MSTSTEITYRRIPHAAHYQWAHGQGHDLELWDVVGETMSAARVAAGSAVPSDAAYSSGYVGKDGVQHWAFTRKAPMTDGPCALCEHLHRTAEVVL